MLAVQRHQKILEMIREQGSVKVTDLAQLFNVTEETVRRDLKHLEKTQFLIRQHGGALLKNLATTDESFNERHHSLVEEKTIIAKKALPLISEGETIFLDSSTTVLHFARMLPSIPLTVITHSCHVLELLRSQDHISLVSTGGKLHADSNSFLGSAAERFLRHYHADKAFISCRSVDESWGASEATEEAANLKRTAVENSSESYLLVDSSKFGQQALAQICLLSVFAEVISEEKTD